MAHDHHHHSSKNIGAAFWLNFGFTLLEIVGGLWTNSTAILSDAVHDLGDSFSLGLAWLLERKAQKGSTSQFSYGYGRFSLLSALINTIVMVTGSLLVLSRVIPRLLNPEPTNAPGMFLFAVIGILVNGAAAWRLRGEAGLNARVVSWHMIEDVLGWAAVLIVSVVLFFTDAYILDPLLSILITLYVLVNVLRNLRQTAVLFLQGVLDAVDVVDLERQIETLPQVQSVHHIHTWSLDGEHHVFSAHLVVDADATRSEAAALKQQVRTMLNGHEFEHTAVVEQLGLEAEISRVDDPFTIAQMGIFTLPQLMIDGQLVRFRYHGRRSIEELDGLVQLVNRTWERRQELTPSYQKRQHPTPMAVFQLLPKTNCKQCGEETCYIFALKLSVGQRQLADCPLLIEPNYVDKRRQLEEIVIDAPAIG